MSCHLAQLSKFLARKIYQQINVYNFYLKNRFSLVIFVGIFFTKNFKDMKTEINLKDFANTVRACQVCNETYKSEAENKLNKMIENLPSGSGFDIGTNFEYKDKANKQPDKKLVFNTSFHHMDENGFYDGWTEHKIIITSSLLYGYDLKVTGINKNDIKDYIRQTFDNCFFMPEIEYPTIVS